MGNAHVELERNVALDATVPVELHRGAVLDVELTHEVRVTHLLGSRHPVQTSDTFVTLERARRSMPVEAAAPREGEHEADTLSKHQRSMMLERHAALGFAKPCGQSFALRERIGKPSTLGGELRAHPGQLFVHVRISPHGQGCSRPFARVWNVCRVTGSGVRKRSPAESRRIRSISSTEK
ncbi:MAG TPA: hypothetical protein VM261_19500 [Kofleriaceae bacterium]|nr:hypothetical protein [Kofleriaceae bacterium]